MLMRGSAFERLNVAVSAPMLIRPRKILRNVLLLHGGLDTLFDCMEAAAKEMAGRKKARSAGVSEPSEDSETESSPIKEDPYTLLSHSVLSLYSLSSHLGVVSPNLKLAPPLEPGFCVYGTCRDHEFNLEFKLDDGSKVRAVREKIATERWVNEEKCPCLIILSYHY